MIPRCHAWAAAAAVLLSSAALADPIANWQVLAGTPATSGLDTNSPVFGDGSADAMSGVSLASRFGAAAEPQSITLAVGETLTVSANLTFTGGLDVAGAYRIGVYDDGGKLAVPSTDNWTGGWNHSTGANLFAARTDGHYASTFANSVNLAATKVTSGTLDGDSIKSYCWSMTITRDSATTVDVVASLTGGDGVFSEIFVANDITTSVFTYTALGIQTTAQGALDQLTISSARFVKPATTTGTWTERTGLTPVSNLDTASPALGDGSLNSADARSIYATIPTVSLNLGDKLTVSGSAVLAGIVGNGNQFRWALYDTNGSGDDTGWLGYMGSQGHAAGVANLLERTDPNTSWYMSSTGGGASAINTANAPGTSFTDGCYDFFLTLELTASGMQIDSSVIRRSDQQQFGLHSFLDTTISTTTFNRVGFLVGTNLDADFVQLSGVAVTLVEATGNLAITSFAPVGGGVWEVTLAGAPSSNYEFRSSTTLDFTPGTLVENLTQGDLGDPGTIGGPNDSVVTTDGNGDAVVRMTLSGSPADFIRAQTTP